MFVLVPGFNNSILIRVCTSSGGFSSTGVDMRQHKPGSTRHKSKIKIKIETNINN